MSDLRHTGPAMARRDATHTILEEHVPLAVRIVLGAVGLLIAFLVVRDLGRSLWPITIGTPVTLSIVLGALFVAGVFLVVALCNPVKRWTMEPRALLIEFRAHAFAQRQRLIGTDVRALWVEPTSDADSAPRFFVCLSDVKDRTWRAPHFTDRGRADAYATHLARHLGVRVTTAPGSGC